METSVIIPTYKRTNDLKKCLDGLSQQTRLPDEVVVVVRDTDTVTRNFLRKYHSNIYIKETLVRKPGQVAALNSGLQTSKGKYICILDDDTVPHKHWLKRIVEIFSESAQIGGVGGRDWVFHGDKRVDGKKDVVGKVQWFGRVVGNHHLGHGSARDVDVLKGANMSYRREAVKGLTFDTRLLGTGAQVHNDMAFSLSVKKRGWRLIYDPEVCVNHYPAQRFDLDERDKFNPEAYYHSIYNETLILSEYIEPSFKRNAFIMWCLLVGTSDRPGVLQLIRLLIKKPVVLRKFLINIKTRMCVNRNIRRILRGLSG